MAIKYFYSIEDLRRATAQQIKDRAARDRLNKMAYVYWVAACGLNWLGYVFTTRHIAADVVPLMFMSSTVLWLVATYNMLTYKQLSLWYLPTGLIFPLFWILALSRDIYQWDELVLHPNARVSEEDLAKANLAKPKESVFSNW